MMRLGLKVTETVLVPYKIARGGNVSAIAQRLHMSDTTIIRWFIEAGFDPPTRSAEDQRREDIIARATEMRAAGQTLRAIAAELHTCEKRLSEWLRRRRGFSQRTKPIVSQPRCRVKAVNVTTQAAVDPAEGSLLCHRTHSHSCTAQRSLH
jgi:hypothetical protein